VSAGAAIPDTTDTSVADTAGMTFLAKLETRQETPPANAATTANGSASCVLNAAETQLDCTVTYAGLTGAATLAHIHEQLPGVAGGVILNFGTALASPIVVSFTTASGDLTAAKIAALKAGRTYVNVHTTMFTGGEIRGQLLGPTHRLFLASPLTGGEEAPTPVSSAANGLLACLDDGSSFQCNGLITGNVTAVTGAHIHEGAVGVDNPTPFFTFALGTAGTTTPFSGNPTLLEEARLVGNTYYVNVHTTEHSGGEVRAQLTRSLP
jgi:hypothetical protein